MRLIKSKNQMTKLTFFAPKTKLTEKEELEKEIIENDDYYLIDGIDEDDEDSIWEGGIFI